MSLQIIEHFSFPNGFTLVVEEMADVQSAAFTLLIPAGSLHEAPGVNGTAAALCDLTSRGAGDRDNRELSAALDNLGVQRHEQVGWNFLSYSAAMLSNHLDDTLEIYADIARRPTLPEEEFEAVMSGLTQALLANEDEPHRKLATEIRRRTYPEPWGRPTEGDLGELPNISMETLREHFRRGFRPNGAILGVAGRVQATAVKAIVDQLFADWTPVPFEEFPTKTQRGSIGHIDHPSTQVQIGIAYPAPPYGHPDHYAAWAASNILGGGPSSRLFTEVRERRGLCYSIQSTIHSLKTDGRSMIYAGTTAERAQETLDVTLEELRRLSKGMGQDELDRCLARAKSSLIMQQESTGARASSLARDWFHLGRITTLDEVRRELEALTIDTVLDVSRRYPPDDLTILTLGPQQLTAGH